VKAEHVYQALNSTQGGAVQEGAVGGGTGMICHEFKGGIGTASRVVEIAGRSYTVGVLVQANYGTREQLTISGVPVGREIPDLMPERKRKPESDSGSIIAVVATDAPLLPHQLKRLARRVPMGLARLGSIGGHYSGDIFLAFSTANEGAAARSGVTALEMLPNDVMSVLFRATIEATEESIVNTLVAGRDMEGIDRHVVYGLPHARLQAALSKYGRLGERSTKGAE
jgi:L-aminopeptidase/D-esterase-like protein